MCMMVFNPSNTTIIFLMPILQIGRLLLREIKRIPQGHTAYRWLSLAFDPGSIQQVLAYSPYE